MPTDSAPLTPASGAGHGTASRSRFLSVCAIVVAAAFLPLGGIVGYPLAVTATWVHEASHGLVMVLTGAGLAGLDVFLDTSGRAFPAHGVGRFAAVFIASAGYVGTAAVAAVLIAAGRWERAVSPALVGLGGTMVAVSLLVGGRVEGRLLVALLGAVLVAFAWAPSKARAVTLDIVGAQLAVDAFTSLWVLFGPGGTVNGAPAASDADNLARLLFGPAWLWALAWAALDVTFLVVALRIRLSSGRRVGASSA